MDAEAMTPRPASVALRILSLCSGIGSIDLAVARAVGPVRVVCAVEREAYAAASLVQAQHEEGLAPLALWSNLAIFDGRPWRGCVDLVTAGLPCQPYSVAGKRRGDGDERALWPHLVRIVEECAPAALFLENVPPFLEHFGPCFDRLRALGFLFAPPLLSTAAEYGAPHDRLRLFVLAAHPDRAGLQGPIQHWQRERLAQEGCESPYADGVRFGQGQRHASPRGGESDVEGRDPRLAHPDRDGLSIEQVGWVFNRQWQTFRHDLDRCGPGCRICGSPWAAESPPVRVAHGDPDWADKIRAVGNAVCVPQAEAAFRLLIRGLRKSYERMQ